MIQLLVAAALPSLFWDRGPETAEALRAASIPCIAAPEATAKAWAAANFCVTAARLEDFEKIPTPGVKWGTRNIGTASATRAPWVGSNGWRFLLRPGRRYLYELPRGKAPLAAAEAFAYGAEAWLRIDPEDLRPLGSMLAFLKAVGDNSGLTQAANIAVVDNGSPLIPEALNLMARRNLLFRVVKAPDPSSDLNVQIGSPPFPVAEAADPVVVADKARRLLTDRKRLLRIYGSEVVLGRLYQGGGRARIHLLNYGGDKIEGIRVRVRGSYHDVRLLAFGNAKAKPTEVVVQGDATEFTIPEMGVYAIAELRITR
jgi:hypothetical protein